MASTRPLDQAGAWPIPTAGRRLPSIDRTLLADAFLGGAGVIAFVAFLSGAFGWTGQAPARPQVTVPAIAFLARGSSQVRRRPEGDLAWQNVRGGDSLWAGDTLYVPPEATAQVRFPDGSSLDLHDAALVVIDRAPGAGGLVPEVKLVRGVVEARAPRRLLMRASGRRVVLDRAQASLRLGADRATRVSVRDGTARLEAGDTRAEIGAMQSGEITSAGAVRAVAPPPLRLIAPQAGAQLMADGAPVSLGWQDAGAAVRYHVEIAADADFREVVQEADVRRTSLAVQLQPGIYHWRVTGRRRTGEPLGSETRLLCIVDPRALVTLSPGDEDVVKPSGEKTFSWTELQGADRYRVEVARSPEMRQPVLVRIADSTTLRDPVALQEGEYWWRVGATLAGGLSAWSEPQAFRVASGDLPPAPRLLDAVLRVEP